MFHKLGRNDDCWCGSGIKYKHCHADYDSKLEKCKAKGWMIPPRKIIKNEAQIQGMRDSAKINVAVLDEVAGKIHAGMSTEEINTIVHEKTVSMGGIPAPLNFEGFPKSVCTSINDQVCHGIPASDIILQDGDIVNVDVSTIYKGFYSDSSRMFCIGHVSPEKEKLVRVARECVEKGLEMVKPWTRLGDLGAAVHEHALAHGYSVVREVGGHGVGLEFHEDPWVGYTTKKDTGMVMTPGMSFTIEPMVNMGTDEIFVDDANGWTIYTDDRQPSAQWEVMVLVTETGYELLAW